ncbi:MAG: hypothetical protein ABGX21_05825 [Candidatus Poseidoniia archaeon]
MLAVIGIFAVALGASWTHSEISSQIGRSEDEFGEFDIDDD